MRIVIKFEWKLIVMLQPGPAPGNTDWSLSGQVNLTDNSQFLRYLYLLYSDLEGKKQYLENGEDM